MTLAVKWAEGPYIDTQAGVLGVMHAVLPRRAGLLKRRGGVDSSMFLTRPPCCALRPTSLSCRLLPCSARRPCPCPPSLLLCTAALLANTFSCPVPPRLYAKAKSLMDPFAYETYRQQRIAKKVEEERKARISIVKKLPKVGSDSHVV